MDIFDYLMGAGIIGFAILIIFIIIVIVLAPIIVAMAVANYLGLTGIIWWAFVIVIWLIISGIISRLSS